MAESKLAAPKGNTAQTPRDMKAKAPSASASAPGRPFPAKPRMTIWDLPDEVTATVLAELRM